MKKLFPVISSFLFLACCMNSTLSQSSLFQNKLAIDSLVTVFIKEIRPFKLVSSGIHDGMFYGIISFDDEYQNNSPNKILVVDLKKKRLHQLVENPAFKKTELPLLDFSSDTLFLLSSYENLLFINDGKSWQSMTLDAKTWHFTSMAKMSNQLILSKSVYGVSFFDNTGKTIKKIYNNPILLHYLSTFSIPLNQNILYGSGKISQDLIELVSSAGWKIQLTTRAAHLEDNFYLYQSSDKFIIVLDSRIITLDIATGKTLNELDFGREKITFHQLLGNEIFFIHYDGSTQTLYQMDVNQSVAKFIGRASATASHFIKQSDQYYLFERDGVYEINSKDSLSSILRKDIRNIYAAEKIVDVSTGKTYFLDDLTLYW